MSNLAIPLAPFAPHPSAPARFLQHSLRFCMTRHRRFRPQEECSRSCRICPASTATSTPQGAVLYVGKARDLKKRVSSYFTKTLHVAAHRDDGDAHRAHRDDRHALRGRSAAAREQPDQGARRRATTSCFATTSRYPYLKLDRPPVSAHGLLPRRGRPASTSTSGRSRARGRCARASRSCRRVFQLRTCEDTVFTNRTRPCLLYQIERCTGAVRRADQRRGLRARRGERIALPARPAGRGDEGARAEDACASPPS